MVQRLQNKEVQVATVWIEEKQYNKLYVQHLYVSAHSSTSVLIGDTTSPPPPTLTTLNYSETRKLF